MTRHLNLNQTIVIEFLQHLVCRFVILVYLHLINMSIAILLEMIFFDSHINKCSQIIGTYRPEIN